LAPSMGRPPTCNTPSMSRRIAGATLMPSMCEL
jgi:hypothetical protein